MVRRLSSNSTSSRAVLESTFELQAHDRARVWREETWTAVSVLYQLTRITTRQLRSAFRKARKCLFSGRPLALRFVPPWPFGGHRTFDSNTLTLGIISPIVLLVPPADNVIYYGRWRARKRTFDCLGLCYARFWARECVKVSW